MADVARSESGVSTLHEATGGDPSRSPGYNLYMRPFGVEQELLVALRTRTGDAWGMLGLYREQGQPLFDADELRFLRDIAPYLAGARRGLLVGEATDPDAPEAPGLVVLREDWSVESLTPGVERWLAELPDSGWQGHGALPRRCCRWRVVRFAPPRIRIHRAKLRWRVLSQAGRWIVLHGASLVADGRRRVAVIIEPAQPARIASLLMAAYGLTEREQTSPAWCCRGTQRPRSPRSCESRPRPSSSTSRASSTRRA